MRRGHDFLPIDNIPSCSHIDDAEWVEVKDNMKDVIE